jgi:hypothetical protein
MMKDINEVIRRKEAELQQLHRDIEALRTAERLLAEEAAGAAYTSRPATGNAYAPPSPPAGASKGGYGASWDAAAKKFP